MDRRSFLTGAAVSGVALAGSSTSVSAETADHTLLGSVNIATDAKPIVITSDSSPHVSDRALIHTKNRAYQAGFRVQSYWSGTAETPYQNNDCGLFECWNTTGSSSRNRSWAVSAANIYNKIAEGVTDSGTRVGVLGWAPSVAKDGYVHEGTLSEQIGIYGRAGYQSEGSGPNAVVVESVGVRGEIVTDSPGASITTAMAGQFVTRAQKGRIDSNMAVYASARDGATNFSFYGDGGNLFNAAKAFFGSLLSQVASAISARVAGNSIEFGHPDENGCASTIGATFSEGYPFVAFSAETDPAGNTFTTRGKPGSVIRGDLDGGIIFGRIPDANAGGQEVVESARFNSRGNLCLSTNPPASASAEGMKGEVAWDDNYVYVCIAPNSWMRSALSAW